ncbi:MAG: Fic family protein [Campylobacterales bacterium]|nr:Fic family protein [Campylobacterales bacterium]
MLSNLLTNLDAKKSIIAHARPMPIETVQSLAKDFHLKYTYHSNAIEGNTLTLNETKVVLEGITIGGKTIVEHLEAINHQEAIHFIESLAKENQALREKDIKLIHGLILKGIDAKNAGQYRRVNVKISGASHTPPSFFSLGNLMTKLVENYQQEHAMHPIEKIARLHADFAYIHPFVDGNGRTARLLMNLELIKSGYLPLIIEATQRATYYDALDTIATKQSYEPFIKFIAELEVKTLDERIAFLDRK